MPQSLSIVYLHLVFSTKDREPYFSKPDLRAALHAWLGATSRELNCAPVIVGGVADHVHILARCGRCITHSDWVKELKRTSSKWIKTQDASLSAFAWQSGYGLFSTSTSQLDAVHDYILKQEEHHRKFSFQDEYRKLLQRHGLDWDERYVWD